MCIACTYIYHISRIYDPVHHGKRSSKWTYRPTVKVAVSMASPTEVNVVLVDNDTKAKTDDSNGNDDENAGENVILITCCDVPVSCRLAVFWRSFDKPWVLSTCCLSRHGICGCPCPFDISFLIPWTVAPKFKENPTASSTIDTIDESHNDSTQNCERAGEQTSPENFESPSLTTLRNLDLQAKLAHKTQNVSCQTSENCSKSLPASILPTSKSPTNWSFFFHCCKVLTNLDPWKIWKLSPLHNEASRNLWQSEAFKTCEFDRFCIFSSWIWSFGPLVLACFNCDES